MSDAVLLPDGRMRRDEQNVARVAAAVARDPELREIVTDVGARAEEIGSGGMLIPATARESGEPVLVKVNAGPHEREWLTALDAADPGLVPHVFGSGDALDEIGLGWMVLERLPHKPPGLGAAAWYAPLLRASFRWQDAASALQLEPIHAIDGPWLASWIDKAIELESSAPLLALRDRFDDDWAYVSSLCPVHHCHGDLHFFNAGSRSEAAPESLVLFDPVPRVAPWPFEAANCETLTNYFRTVPDGRPLVSIVAEHRRGRGLPTPGEPDVLRISSLFCAWLAVFWRTLFKDLQPDRPVQMAWYLERLPSA